MNIAFEEKSPFAVLDAASTGQLDASDIGIVRMDRTGIVTAYNATEAMLSGLSRERVIGRNFFSDIAPCTNNYLVAQRFETEPDLDAVVDYVFTLRMKPTPVALRLLKSSGHENMYLLVRRRTA